MEARQRLWLAAAVVITAVAVGAAGLGWIELAGQSGAVAAMAIAAGLVLLVLFASTGGNGDAEEDLARRIRALPAGPRVSADSKLRAVAHAVNDLVDRGSERAGELEREAATARAAMDASPTGILIVDQGGQVVYANPAVRELVTVIEPIEGRPPVAAIHIAEVQKAAEQALERGRSDELTCSAGDRDLSVRGVRTAHGGAVVLLSDVTGFRRAERIRSEFVANVSHELRTPIATITGYAETLNADKNRLDPETAQMAAVIHRHATRLSDLFEDLLELARIELRRRELPLEVVPLAPVVAEAVVGAVDRASERRQTFDVDVADDLSAAINAEALQTVLRNLAQNATNYTPEGGHVTVRATAVGDEVRIDVIDDGIGIDRVHHERIFERFYRVDEGRSRKLGGTGLGLAIVKHLCLASGARVSVQSEIGRGSVFSVHLPSTPPSWSRRR